MISNYLKVAFRSLKNQKVYSFLNVLGLTIGISSAILIFLFINDELSYDKHHKKAVNIYRLNSGYHLPNSGPFEAYATSNPMVGEAIVKDYPEVVQMCRFNRLTNQMMELPTTQEIIFEEIWAADSNIFSMFTMPLIQGNPRLALDEPYTLVVTRNKARDLFGTEDVLSKTIFFPEDSLEFKITGVMENYPSSSHLKLDIITSIETLKSQNWRPNWWNFNFHTYLELAKNTNAANLENNIQFISRRYIPEQEDGSGYRQEYSLIPLTDIHLNSNLRAEMEANSQLSYIYIFGIIGLFIVLIASINYMNLATASSVKQAKEVGIRKVSGASKADLFSRFMSESLLTTIFSLALSCLVIAITLPELNDLADKSISLSVLLNPLVIFTILCLVFFVGLISGSYPSLYLSAIQPKETLKGSFSSNKKGASLRKFLVIIQFTISIALITGTIIVYNQLDYLRNIRLGFNKEQILVVPIKSNTDEFKLIQNKSKDLSFVLGASISSQVPGKEMYNNVVRKGWDDEAEWSDMRYLTVDYDFLNLYGVKVLEGRSFKEDFASDKEEALILNESGVQRLGYSSNKDAIGKKLKWQNRKGYVIGVVEDFHFMAANTPVEPFIITMNTAYSAGYLTIKLNTEKTAENISGVENLFHSVLPNQTFDFFFLDNDYDTQYKAEDRFMKIFTAFAIIAIVIACLGLYGLAMFTAEQKFKEIGIRKVLGASIKNLIYIQVKGFLILVLVAFLVSIPITYFSMTQWLESFPSKNQIGFTVFLTSGLGSILIAWVTVSYQSFKASSINPVDSIRSNNG